MICLITYDLNSPGQNYDKVIQTIKDCSTGKYCSYWKSAFLIQTRKSVLEITNAIRPFLDGSDRLLVIEVKSNYQGWLPQENWDYINNMFDIDFSC